LNFSTGSRHGNKSFVVSALRIACPAETPIGTFTAIYEDGTIRRILYPGETPGAGISRLDESLDFASQIKEYFAGKRKAFDLPVLIPGTDFRRNVYKAAIRIPYGGTAAYSEVALAAGYPLAMRAVGSAMKANQLPLIIPCHRVVHKSEKKFTYSGGDDMKSFLLELERKYK
jgi:methylated-DNA-[protein]-cysteine S-methyltransferase